MEKKLIKSESIWIGNINYEITFFQITKSPDQIYYSSEVTFGSFDTIIIDDEDLVQLENKTRLILPVAHRSRMVATMEAHRGAR
ncbi:MAG: hypothetical protein ACMUIA_12255 [bacterium]